MRIFIDTNIWLDFILNRDDKRGDIRDFISICLANKHHLYISSLSLRDIGYVVQRTTHDWIKTRKVQASVYGMATKVVGVSSDAAIDSLFSNWKDYEDALQNIAAEESMCDCIATDNIDDFKKAKLPVFTLDDLKRKLTVL